MDDYDKQVAELEQMTMKQLRAIAHDEGICLGYDGATKHGTARAIASQRWHREKEDER